MSLTRSRPRTENKFIDAVVDLLRESGCGSLGINSIAQRAGADKVLIYRYFKDLNGLLEQVACEIEWLPEPVALLPQTEREPRPILQAILEALRRYFARYPASQQLLHWRKAVDNPLTQRFNSEWEQLWQSLAHQLAEDLGYDARRNWETAIALTALLLEAELGGQPFNTAGFERAIKGLTATSTLPAKKPITSAPPIEIPDALPTNLL